jgi:hypothetical protein
MPSVIGKKWSSRFQPRCLLIGVANEQYPAEYRPTRRLVLLPPPLKPDPGERMRNAFCGASSAATISAAVIKLSELRLNNLAVGTDGRNRTLLSRFKSKTARNQPSNAKFIFGPSVWLRGLIKLKMGHSVAYLDRSSQEIAIAAALSGDDAMWKGYATGDP